MGRGYHCYVVASPADGSMGWYSCPRCPRSSAVCRYGCGQSLEPAPAPLVECVKPGQCEEGRHVENVKHPPSSDAEDARAESIREVHHHVDDVTQPYHEISPAGDDHPPISPALQFDEAVCRR